MIRRTLVKTCRSRAARTNAYIKLFAAVAACENIFKPVLICYVNVSHRDTETHTHREEQTLAVLRMMQSPGSYERILDSSRIARAVIS